MSTTISSYSVSLGLNAQDYIKNSALARGETAALKKAINEAKTPMERYAGTYDLLEKGLAKGAIGIGTFKRLLDEAKVKAGLLSREVAKTTTSITYQTTALGKLAAGYQGVTSKLSPLVGMLGAYLGLATAKKAIGLSIGVENASVQFEVLTGSMDDSLVLMRELRSFAEKSPITFSGAQDAAKTLLSFNVAAQDVIPTVQMLGAVTGGNNERFKMMSLAFAQTSAAGRLMGQDLLQMINAGFNPLQEISRKTGESLIDLKKRMEDGGVSSQEVAAAFQTATAEGGKFHGMTERLAETVGGKLNIAMSDLQKSGERLGTILGPVAADFLKMFADAAESAGPLLWVIQKMSDGLRFILAFAKDAATIASDIGSKMTGGKGSGRTDAASNVNAFLDELDQRPAKEAARAAQEKNAKMSERTASNRLASAEKETDAIKRQTEAAKLKKEEEKKSLELAKERQREQDRIAKQAENQRLRAFQNAQKYFEEERRRQIDHQRQLRNTKISSLEAGSEGAASYLQDQRNQAMFGRQEAMSSMAQPSAGQVVKESARQLEALQTSNAKQERMVALLGSLVDESKQNGFRRFR